MHAEMKHRPGPFKQPNKVHKTGRHKSKGQLEKEAKGRVSVKVLGRKLKSQVNRQTRRNQANQCRKQKREEILAKKRSRGGQGTPPFLVAVVPLNESVDVPSVLELIKTCDDSAVVTTNELGITHISVPRFKQRFAFTCPAYGDLYALLDAVKVADCTLFLLTEEGTDAYGEYCMSCLFSQGLPASSLAVQGLKNSSIKKQSEVKKTLLKQMEKRFPGEKLHNIDSHQEALLLLRVMGNQKQKELMLREHRSHLIADDMSFELPSPQETCGTLKVSGYVRSQPLSANDLVHIPGLGDFRILQIDAPEDPYPLNPKLQKQHRKTNSDAAMEEGVEEGIRVLQKADPSRQAALDSQVIPDPMEGEQTWPTEEELAEAEAEYQTKKRVVKRVPKGTSEYQASWIIDSDNDEEDDEEYDEDDADVDQEMAPVEEAASQEGSDMDDGDDDDAAEEYETITVTEGDHEKYDDLMDLDDERKMLQKYKEERMDQQFPDEIDTPLEIAAKVRFQKFRGLKSFRTSPWDPKENLPADYARIFQFENFRRSKKRILSEEKDEGALPGWYVTVHIAHVPRSFMETYTTGKPVVIFALLAHEQRMSVLNLLLRRQPDDDQPISSKERMICHVGYRRFATCPVYSQHTNASKHKLERFFRNNVSTVATVFAPIVFPPATVLMFKETVEGQHDLIATGSLMSVDPDRVIIKRLVISGHPFKINKKSAVVRYMFFNRGDILWFKPIELNTKWGRRGHIREPLGTHGHMKVVFDGQLKSQDTIMMNLYKRVFPKWTYESTFVPPPVGATVREASMVTRSMTSELFD